MDRLCLSRPRRKAGRVAFALLAVSLAIAGAYWGVVSWKIRSARAALHRGDFETAVTTLQAAEHWPPRRAETAFLLARAFRRSGELEQCSTWLEIARSRGWTPDDLQTQHKLLELQSGRFAQTQSWLSRILSSSVDDDLAEEVYEAQAKGLLGSYRLNDAVVCLRFWVQWKPQAIQPRLWLADTWERCDRWQSAADEYQAIIDLDPNHIEARRHLAGNLLNLNQVERAFGHYQFCAERTPQNKDVVLGIARCQRRLGHPDDAERTLLQALETHGDDTRPVDMLVELGQIELDLRHTDQALDLLREATQVDPGNALAQITLSEAYRKTGQIALAEEHRDLADLINRRYDRLTKIIGQLTEVPGDADLRFEAGQLLMEQGLKAEGAAWMATALESDPEHGPTHLALEEYFISIGEMERASHHRQARERASSRSESRKPRTSSK